jgi:hypothetical protein
MYTLAVNVGTETKVYIRTEDMKIAISVPLQHSKAQ